MEQQNQIHDKMIKSLT